MKKLTPLLIALLFCVFQTSAQIQLEGQIGIFENTAAEDNNERLDNPGGFAGILTTGRIQCLQGTLDARIKTTLAVELQALAHFNILWLVEPLTPLFENNDTQISLLVGGGYVWSKEYYNNFDMPFDMRLNFQTKKMRFQAGLQTPLLESRNFETNWEFFALFAYDIPFRWNSK